MGAYLACDLKLMLNLHPRDLKISINIIVEGVIATKCWTVFVPIKSDSLSARPRPLRLKLKYLRYRCTRASAPTVGACVLSVQVGPIATTLDVASSSRHPLMRTALRVPIMET